MNPEVIGAYIAAAGGVLGPLGLWAWKFIDRTDKNRDLARTQRTEQENNLFNRQDIQLDRAYKRIIELDLAMEELEKDRDRLAEVGWAWYTKANELRHMCIICLADLPVDHELRVRGLTSLPGFNDIVPPVKKPILK